MSGVALASAVQGEARRHAARAGSVVQLADVASASPLRLELQGSRHELHDDELILSQSAKGHDFAAGDVAVLVRKSTAGGVVWLVIDAIGDDDGVSAAALASRVTALEAINAGPRLTALEAATRPRAFTARGSGTTAIAASDVPTKYPFPTEDFDSDGDYDAGNTRYVAPTNGWYTFTAGISLPAPGAAGTRWIMLLAVGGASVRQLKIDWTGSTWANDYSMYGASGPIRLTAGDQVTVLLRQNTAAPLSNGSASSFFTGSRVGLA